MQGKAGSELVMMTVNQWQQYKTFAFLLNRLFKYPEDSTIRHGLQKGLSYVSHHMFRDTVMERASEPSAKAVSTDVVPANLAKPATQP